MKTYFKLTLALYFAALVVCLACRVILKMDYIDMSTGFYLRGNTLVPVFNAVLGAALVILFAVNRLKKADGDYPVDRPCAAMNVLAVLTGLTILAFAVIGAPESHLQQGYTEQFNRVREWVNLALGCLSGLGFVYLGISGVFGRKSAPFGALVVTPAIWQIVSLITRYNSYTTVLAISDHLLVVLFMLFSSLFLMAQARTICSQIRKDGRNYAIPSGLSASLCGFLLTVPNLVLLFQIVFGPPMNNAVTGMMSGTGLQGLADIFLNLDIMPVSPMVGLAETVYIFVMSVYSLAFVISLTRSIKRV